MQDSSHDQPFPNELRAHRDRACLTRQQLSALSARLAEADSVQFTYVGYTTIQNLERGLSQPRASTARTLAQVLQADVREVFPRGLDVKSRYKTRTVNSA